MQSVRAGLGLVGAVLPIVYCAVLAWYFVDIGGWDSPWYSEQLQPTIIGLAIIGLVFTVVLGFRLRRLFGGRPPQDGSGPHTPPVDDGPEDKSDVDAMIARYLAERSAPQPSPAIHPAAPKTTTFGRRVR